MGSGPSDPETTDATSQGAGELDRARAALKRNESTFADPTQGSGDAGMFASLQTQLAQEDTSLIGALRTKSSSTRRVMCFALLLAIVSVDLIRHASGALEESPMRVAVSMLVFGVLMVAMLSLSLRPIHQPALSRRAEALWVGGSVAAALLLSLWPTVHAHGSLIDAWHGATGCLTYGLCVAVPVYVIARMFDRGSFATSLFAAVAAGLCANFVLMTHCPMAGADHMLLGHFGVIATLGLAYSVWSRFSTSS